MAENGKVQSFVLEEKVLNKKTNVECTVIRISKMMIFFLLQTIIFLYIVIKDTLISFNYIWFDESTILLHIIFNVISHHFHMILHSWYVHLFTSLLANSRKIFRNLLNTVKGLTNFTYHCPMHTSKFIVFIYSSRTREHVKNTRRTYLSAKEIT
jgi:hypothetical protein